MTLTYDDRLSLRTLWESPNLVWRLERAIVTYGTRRTVFARLRRRKTRGELVEHEYFPCWREGDAIAVSDYPGDLPKYVVAGLYASIDSIPRK